MTTTITLPWPPQTLNANARVHWRKQAASTKLARWQAAMLAREAKLPMAPESVLKFTYHPPDNRRRDAQNLPGMLKAYIDGIADHMGVDDHGFECRFPSRFAEVRKGGEIVVEITAPIVLVEHRGTINGNETA